MSLVQNIILIATKNSTRNSVSDLLEKAESFSDRDTRMVEYANNLIESADIVENDITLTDDYAPTTSLLNPVTQAPYEGGKELLYGSSLNPFIITGMWILVFLSIYFLYTVIEKKD